MARARRTPEPNEPTVGMEVPGAWRGMGPSRVARVNRRDGLWVSVSVTWQAGCMPCLDYPDQPVHEWSVPTGRATIFREDWEALTGRMSHP